MANRLYHGDIAVMTAGGFDLLGSLESVQYALSVQDAEGGAIAYIGESPVPVKKGAKISAVVMSNNASGRVTNLDVTALTIGGTSYVAALDGGSFNGSFSHEDGSADKDIWQQPNVVKKAYAGSFDLFIDPAAMPAFQSLFHTGAASDLFSTFSVTINSVAMTLPVMLSSYEHMGDFGKLQKVKLGFKGRDLLAGAAYPTAPTGSATLLATAFNAPRTLLAYEFKSAVATSADYTGNMVWSSFGVNFANGAIVKTSYEWASHGACASA